MACPNSLNLKNMARSKKILIADPDPRLVSSLVARCEALGLEVHTAYDAHDTVRLLLENVIDLLCVDGSMQADQQQTVCDVISQDEVASQIPVIALMNRQRSSERVNHRLLAYHVIKSPTLPIRVQPIIEELLDLETCTV